MSEQSTLGQFDSQTSLIPAGTGAEGTLVLTITMSVAATLIFLAVMAAVWLAWRRERPGHIWWLWAGGFILPVIALVALMVGSTFTLASIARVDRDALVIEVTGHQYWWDVVYDPDGRALRDANEIILPVDTPVTFRLKSEDVIHSFWVPSISGKIDMIPGRVNELTVEASRTGRFRGQCAEFCGLSHPLMAFEVVVLEKDDFDSFTAGLSDEARDADTLQLKQGRDVFLSEGCSACHAIRGVAEGARVGPDLTRVGARGRWGPGCGG
ncbi:cytochrome c oxidase subunit II [Roseovarius sp. B08]|uniref:cytochrome c oxidase subunit II n=1 Tax=Roseovarius sp. B08 TaxID=3449223 RepID=UPI003EDC41AA